MVYRMPYCWPMNALKRELTWAAKRALSRRSVSLMQGAARMTPSFFSRTAHIAVAGALALAIVWAAVRLAPTALDRWF